ncbi:VanZ family protein [Paenibacillus sp. G2S3]|uniref:VanZ family protein n=1 Tax=Paenibacillus sp. G2S3 TaxID=3047872 RepID=UPI0024C10BDF|nr:VanZ family protein [Paenibacillus sp. G2S3]WHY21751.1 VanZ family protein [Paenibacillus sp. G2S3]
MFHSYFFPISYAFMMFPIAALIFTLPFLIVQYRRHGYIHKLRALILYLLLLYLMNAYFLVLLPMPSSRHNMAPSGSIMQLIPLQFIQDIIDGSKIIPDQISTYWSLLREPAFLQVIFNIALTVPFGLFLGYYFRARWGMCILLSFILSLSFEVTQVTGIYGFFDHPYRLFDVDDLITNTLGGIFGFRIAIWINGLLPRIEQLDTNIDRSAKRVSYTRRGIAFFIDSMVWIIGFGVLYGFDIKSAFWIVTGIYFILIPAFTGGRTLGKWIVRIRVTSKGNRASFWALMIRYGLLYWILLGLHALVIDSDVTGLLSSPLRTVAYLIVLLVDLAFFIHLVIKVFKKNDQLIYEQLSRTSHVISWPEKRLNTDTSNSSSIED